MITKKSISYGYFFLALLAWLSVFIYDWAGTYALYTHKQIWLPESLKAFSVNFFLISVMLFYKLEIGSIQTLNFRELLWKTFLTAGASIFVITLIRLLLTFLSIDKVEENAVLMNVFYNFNAAFTSIFLANAFFVFKRLVLFQKTKRLIFLWRIFEYSVILLIILNFFNFEQVYSVYIWLIVPYALMSLYFSFNVRWVAYLNFNHKLQGIMLLGLIMVISIIFLEFHYEYNNSRYTHIDLSGNLFSIALFVFVFLYCLISLLVLLFNLPTSSVFEQKFEEVLSFQKLSQTVTFEKEEEKIYEVLFDSCYNIILANAAWLEIVDENGIIQQTTARNITIDFINDIKDALLKNGIKDSTQIYQTKNLRGLFKYSDYQILPYKSLIVLPLFSNGEQIGSLGLLKNIKDSFDKEMVDIISTYLSQASVAIHNARLLKSAIENERYKAQSAIVRKVQQRLLPTYIEVPHYDIGVSYTSAEDVGGDYYDFIKVDNKLLVIIGDVSGKGTSAAFNMAQMKGIFHTLATIELNTKELLSKANEALSLCIERNSFITVQLLLIDLQTNEIEHSRAGHCPLLFCNSQKTICEYIQIEGIGLGLIKGESIDGYLENKKFIIQNGDAILLYTDGITEARNEQKEEFGYERLREVFFKYANFASRSIIEQIKSELYHFTNGHPPEDDVTLLVIKKILK